MKCISCEVVIDPKWKHAVEQNACPFCGNVIMPEELKGSLTLLAEIMKELENYPEQRNDWLLSNYNYIKTDSPDLVNYVPADKLKPTPRSIQNPKPSQTQSESLQNEPQVKVEHGEEFIVEKLKSDEEVQSFLDRTDFGNKKNSTKNMSLADRTAHLKQVASQIKKTGTVSVNESGETTHISSQLLNQNLEDAQDMESLFNDPLAEANPYQNNNQDDGLGIDDSVPAFVLNMAKTSNSSDKEKKDLAALQRIMAKSKGVSGSGSFSRG